MFSFAFPEFLWMLPIVFLPLLLDRRRDERWEVRAWSSMNFLVRAMKPLAKQRQRQRLIKVLVRMSLLLTTILILAKPQTANSFFATTQNAVPQAKILDGTNSPQVARAREILRPENISNEVFILGEKLENVETRGKSEKQLGTKLRLENFPAPREVNLEILDASHPLIVPLLTHHEKFRLTLQKVWVAENTQTPATKLKPILAARDENGNQFSLISEVVETHIVNGARKILWHTSPDEAYSSLATSAIFLPLLDKSIAFTPGEVKKTPQKKSAATSTVRHWEIGFLACVGVLLTADFLLRRL